MSCQQASRFITATATTTVAAAAAAASASAKATATKRIAATAAAATPTTTTLTAAKSALQTPVNVASFAIAAGKTNTPEDPYVFTETIAATPPILFNAQKSRARLSEAQHSRKSNSNKSNNNNNNKQTVASRKSSIVAATTTAPLIAQLNGTATATTVAAAARATTTKAQASLGATTPNTIITAATTTTTNFNNVTQSQRQATSQTQLQLQSSLQSQLQLQSQASPKRATNVCVVRPQQQQQQLQQQQQQQLKQQQAKLITKHVAPQPPPPLFTHTPSLWQTPLLLDTTQKQQQQLQQLQQQQPNLVIATALVSPPTLPASLPSPTVNAPPTAAVTAMVSPIVLPLSHSAAAAVGAMSPPKGGSLPPSKFHHTTLAQHLQKVECLKKKKSLPLVCQNANNNNNTIVEPLQKPPFAGYNLTHPPPLTVFNTAATVAAEAVAAPAVAKKKHSAANAVDNRNDLNEIPVNVIFRKPPVQLAGANAQTQMQMSRPAEAKIAMQSTIMMLGTVAPLTLATAPPLPLQLPATTAAALAPALALTSTPAPALIIHTPAGAAAAGVTTATQTEQMSSKVANSVAGQAGTTKRRAPAANAACRKGNKTCNKIAAHVALPPPPTPTPPQLQSQNAAAAFEPTSASRVAPRRKAAPAASKRSSELFSENEPLLHDVAYCLQTRWLHAAGSDKDFALETPSMPSNREREERIAVRKSLLRRQALQLLSTRTLQELPMRAARQRLQSVQSLLLKYQDHANQQHSIGIGNRCLVTACKQPTLSMAAHCERHIVSNSTQQLFQPCVAWRVDGTACQLPVFDMLHTLALCPEHSHLRRGLEQQSRQLQQQQQQKTLQAQSLCKPASMVTVAGTMPATATAAAVLALANVNVNVNAGKRKRKTNPNANPVGRPQKRTKKQPAAVLNTPAVTLPALSMNTLPPMSAVLQRKSSTTSLESIASNSQSSAKSHSALPPYTPTAPVLTMPQLSIIPPALAPLSADYQLTRIEPVLNQQPHLQQQQQHQLQQQQHQPHQQLDLLANANFKADEISQIVAQLAAASSELHHNNINNNNHLHYNNNNINNMSYSSNNNSNSGSSSISCGFPSFNAAFGNTMACQGQNQIHGHQAISRLDPAHTTLDSTETLLNQHMFGICDNSSAYASSEDTGLGGLSDSELIGANDADDIALNGAHLLEEHDLVNVFDTLPDDAFNELFQSVQQAECEAMDRALEIADKNLKCLQQTIGSTAHDNNFLNDLLDVGDDLLVNAVMNSPDTSGIDASTLFVDTSSGGGNSSSSNGPAGGSSSNSCTPATTVADIRGLVLT